MCVLVLPSSRLLTSSPSSGVRGGASPYPVTCNVAEAVARKHIVFHGDDAQTSEKSCVPLGFYGAFVRSLLQVCGVIRNECCMVSGSLRGGVVVVVLRLMLVQTAGLARFFLGLPVRHTAATRPTSYSRRAGLPATCSRSRKLPINLGSSMNKRPSFH